MSDGVIIDLEEVRRVRQQVTDSVQAQEESVQRAPVNLAVRGKDQIEFTIADDTYTLTEEVARSWIRHLHEAVRRSQVIGEPICQACGRHACRQVHPGQRWKRKTDKRVAIVKSVFGARIQLLQESGRITTVTGQHRLRQRYLGPWDWDR